MTEDNNAKRVTVKPLRSSALDKQRMQELVLQSAAALQCLHRMLLDTVDVLDDHLTVCSQYACQWLQKLSYANQRHTQGNRAWQQLSYGELYHIDVSDVCQGLISGMTQQVQLCWSNPLVTQAAPNFLRSVIAYLLKWCSALHHHRSLLSPVPE